MSDKQRSVVGDCHACGAGGTFLADVADRRWRCDAGGSIQGLIPEAFRLEGRAGRIAMRNVREIIASEMAYTMAARRLGKNGSRR